MGYHGRRKPTRAGGEKWCAMICNNNELKEKRMVFFFGFLAMTEEVREAAIDSSAFLWYVCGVCCFLPRESRGALNAWMRQGLFTPHQHHASSCSSPDDNKQQTHATRRLYCSRSHASANDPPLIRVLTLSIPAGSLLLMTAVSVPTMAILAPQSRWSASANQLI